MEFDDGAIVSAELRLAPRSDSEKALTEYGHRLRRFAEDRSRSALGGFDIPVVAQALDDAVMALVALEPGFAAGLVDDATWDRFIAEHRADHPFLAHASRGSGTVTARADVARPPRPDKPMSQPWTVPGGLSVALLNGETYVIHHLDQYDRGGLREFSEDLEFVFGNAVSTNAYISRDRATGFGAHWDDHHVLILQVRGRKGWEVFAPAALSPERGFVSAEAAGEPLWSGVLEPGQALFIPRGWSHRVMGLDELSVHYTIAVSGPTVRSVLAAIANATPDDVELGEGLRSWLEERTADPRPYLEQTLAYTRAVLGSRPRSGIEAVEVWRAEGSDPSRVRVLLPGGAVFHGEAPDDGGVTLAWSNAIVRLSCEEVDALLALPEGRPATSSLCSDLLAHGLARIEPA